MSELMGDIRAEPKPGTALRIMVEEYRHLDEFMAMVKAKMDLDEKHLSGLKTLRDSWNPQWNDSGIWPLISPFLTHINNEITQWENAATELNSRFTSLPNTPPPNALHEDGFDPLVTLESVQIRYSQYEQCHTIISTPESISELKRWRTRFASESFEPLYEMGSANLEILVLPKHEREYRRAVVAQHTAVERAAKWHTDTLPGVLERHQQCAEGVKSFLNVLFNFYSAIYSGLSTSCSAALSSNRAFFSSEFISPRHDETEKETSHALLRAVDYRNYMLDGVVTQPMFGLGVEKTMSLINELLDCDAKSASSLLDQWHGSWVSTAFEIERAATRWELSALLESLSKGNLGWIWMSIRYAFLMDEPLLPLPGDVITQYRTGISRTKLSSAMDAYLSLARQEVLTLLVRLMDALNAKYLGGPRERIWKVTAGCLSHNNAAAGIIESIWRKWDIENDRPLPEGVERVRGQGGWKSEVVWKRSGSPYYATMSNSSI